MLGMDCLCLEGNAKICVVKRRGRSCSSSSWPSIKPMAGGLFGVHLERFSGERSLDCNLVYGREKVISGLEEVVDRGIYRWNGHKGSVCRVRFRAI